MNRIAPTLKTKAKVTSMRAMTSKKERAMSAWESETPAYHGRGGPPSPLLRLKSSASVKSEPEFGLASSPPRTPVPKLMPPKGEAGGGVPKGEAGGGEKAGGARGRVVDFLAPGAAAAAALVAGPASSSAKSEAAMNSATSSPRSSRLSRASRRATWAAPSSKGCSFSEGENGKKKKGGDGRRLRERAGAASECVELSASATLSHTPHALSTFGAQ